MRIRVHSDLHLEFSGWTPPPVAADVVVLAGDIALGTSGVRWARDAFPGVPVVYVAGNHEFFGGRVQEVRAALRAEGRRLGIHVLDEDEVTIGGVRFLGTTLWTDFALYGADPDHVRRAMLEARRAMHDYRAIRYDAQSRFEPEHALRMHREQRAWLEARVATPDAPPTVVVTHHLPHRRSIHPKFYGDSLNACFASDLAQLFRPPVALWVHGHTHESLDYVENGVRVVCNPRGYIPMQPNLAFEPALVVGIDAG
jgi:predicted phosphodiesterase